MPTNHNITRITLAAIALVLGVTVFFLLRNSDEQPLTSERTMAELELREGDILHVKETGEIFSGILADWA